jgi:molybdopterin/thiamine biosynthesis adenylyltransferase
MTLFTENESERYYRQLIVPEIGEQGQEKLKNSSVVVVGAGGLGSPVLMYLAAAGIGNIGIIDSDTVSLSNLQRQIIYFTKDISRLKAEAAAERITMLNPLVNVQSYPMQLSEENAFELLKGYDLAVDCSDNYTTRYLVSDATLQAVIPMVYGAVFQFMGQASVFNYRGGPSYRDLFPEEMQPVNDKPPTPPGIIGPLPGIIGSVQACEAIKIITGIGEVLSGRLLQIDAAGLRAEIISF